jgi:flagellin
VLFGLGTNIAALRIGRQLESTSSSLSKGFERLSSGSRITRASDDAAGLAIASALNAKTRIANQGVRNTNDAVSLLNIGEAAVGALTQIVIRQRELAEQSANGVYSDDQRVALETEYQALSLEYTRILEQTNFNGRAILEGNAGALNVQAGGSAIEARLLPPEFTASSQTSFATSNLNISGGGTVLQTNQMLLVTDFNGDGFDDLVAFGLEAGKGSTTLVVRTATGSASGLVDTGRGVNITAPAAATGFNTFGAAVGATQDRLLLNTRFTGAAGQARGTITINADGSATFVSGTVSVTNQASTTVSGDFNDDGVSDSATSNFGFGMNNFAQVTLSSVTPTTTVTVTSLTRSESSVVTSAKALLALDSLANDLALLSQTSATLGASLSRMETAKGALAVRSAEFAAAADRIQSADVASESARIIQGRIRQEVAAAVLSQNNLQSQQVLRLIRG